MKELIKKLISVKTRRKILTFLNHFWVRLCGLLPLKDRVLFYTIRADGSLAGNAAAVYDALDCKKLIFAHKLEHSNLLKVKAYRLILTSKVIVTDDYCRYMRALKLRDGQRLIQIWHGCGAFKRFGLDADYYLSADEEKRAHSQYSAVAVTGSECIEPYAGAFGIDRSVVLPLGMPETDILINSPQTLREKFYSSYPELSGKTLFVYCPTFRETGGVTEHFNPGIDWDKLSEELGENEVFIISRHPLEPAAFTEKNYPNIKDMTSVPTTELLSVASVHITDYSSTVYEATLLGVPTVFYCPDLEKYNRGFYIRFPDDLPGDVCEKPEELPVMIGKAKEKPPVSKMEKFRNGQLSACDGHSTERIAELIRSWL